MKRIPVPDPWERLDTRPHARQFGAWAPEDFQAFLTGPSHVVVRTVEDVLEFLTSCRSVAAHSEGASGRWPQPVEFERLRAGDCTAHAVWAWRKLIDLGLDADLVAGWQVYTGVADVRHAWVVLRQTGEEYLIDPVLKERKRLMRPLHEIRDAYRPEVGVDRRGERFAYAGALLSVAEKVGGGYHI